MEEKFMGEEENSNYRDGLGMGFDICNKLIKRIGPANQNF
jgi:K+-sensing histidine kinase KdpD